MWQLGTGPFLDGLRAVDAAALAAAFALAALTTVCCAWRWRIVARGLGVELPLGSAVAAYYRSIFLNVTLPGGVVGDVHRGIGHGLRAVVWERTAGQVVQIVLTVAVLLVLPSPVRRVMPFVALGLLAAAAVRRAGALRQAAARSPGARAAWPAIALASALVAAGHAVTFLIAARTAGVTAPADRSCCRWRCSCCCSPRSPTSAAGGRARAPRPGRSPPPAWARRSGSPPRSCTA